MYLLYLLQRSLFLSVYSNFCLVLLQFFLSFHTRSPTPMDIHLSIPPWHELPAWGQNAQFKGSVPSSEADSKQDAHTPAPPAPHSGSPLSLCTPHLKGAPSPHSCLLLPPQKSTIASYLVPSKPCVSEPGSSLRCSPPPYGSLSVSFFGEEGLMYSMPSMQKWLLWFESGP